MRYADNSYTGNSANNRVAQIMSKYGHHCRELDSFPPEVTSTVPPLLATQQKWLQPFRVTGSYCPHNEVTI